MKKALRPPNEAERLECLKSFSDLDRQVQDQFDQIAELISHICGTQVGLISFVNENILQFKSHHGIGISEVPRETSFCGHAILQDDIFIVEDAKLDERFKDNPFVEGEPKIRFYAGAPLITSDHFKIGTLCIIDFTPRKLNKTQILALKSLSILIINLLETRKRKNQIKEEKVQLENSQKKSLEQLKIETSKVEQFFDVSADLMSIASREGVFKKVNRRFIEVLGHSEKELLEIPFKKFIHPEDISRTDQAFNTLLAGNHLAYFENRYRCKNGEYKIMSWSAAPNPITGDIYASARDVTDFRKNEFDLRQTLTLLNENTIVSKTDENGVITFANDKFCEISKFSRNELIGKKHAILNSGYHVKDFFCQMWSTIKAGNIWRAKIKNKDKNGDFYWVDTTIAPFVAESGKSEFISISYDITKEKSRQHIMDEISEIRARFIDYFSDQSKFIQYIINKLINLGESEFGLLGIMKKEDDESFLKIHTIIDRSWDYAKRDSILNKVAEGIYIKMDDPLFGEIIQDASPFISNNVTKASRVLSDFSQIKNIMSVPILYSGKFIAVISLANTNHDYSEKRFNELQTLFDVVGEMIHALMMEEEIQSQKNIILHNSKLASIGQLAAGVGHEINNPLAIISGQLTITSKILKAKGIEDKEILDRFNQMDIAISRISNIVTGLRSFSRSDSTLLTHCNIFELIDEVVRMIKDIYQKEGVELIFKGNNDGVGVFGNRGRLQQILVNLISNARDATAGLQSRQIMVELKTKDKDVLISVHDNGCGIAENLKEKIFEPFFTTKKVNEGTGIGLAIVNTIIKEHNGKITVESVPNQGTTFKISLPRDNVIKLGPDKSESLFIKEEEFYFKGSILVVDDEDELREILQVILSEMCEKVVVTSNANQALEILKQDQIDLVISDITMPEVDGFSFLNQLRKENSIIQPKFLFITGGVQLDKKHDEIVHKYTNGLLTKPFKKKLIVDKLLSLFPGKVIKKVA